MLLRRKQEKEFPKCRESLWSPQVVTQTPSHREYYHAQDYPVNDENFKSVAAKEPDQDRDDEVADRGRYNRADDSRLIPLKSPAVIVIPERETPGITARAWAAPTASGSSRLTWASSLG